MGVQKLWCILSFYVEALHAFNIKHTRPVYCGDHGIIAGFVVRMLRHGSLHAVWRGSWDRRIALFVFPHR